MSEHTEYGSAERVREHSGTSHALAIGFYVAALVMIFGLTLVLYGVLGPAQQVNKSLGINLNLWWGLFMILFGLAVGAISYYSPRRRAARRNAGTASGRRPGHAG